MNFQTLFLDARLGPKRHFFPGDVLLYPESRQFSVLFLQSGTVEVSRYDARGIRILQSFMQAPQCFGVIELFANAPLMSGVRALTEGSYFAVSESSDLFEDDAVLKLLLRYVSGLYEKDMRLSAYQKHMRGKDKLLFTIYHAVQAPFPFTLGLSREDLSDLLGIAPRSLYRYLNELEAAGYFKRIGGKIVVNTEQYAKMDALFHLL